jgi:hypothetical protein
VLKVYRLTTQKHNGMSNFNIVIATQANNIYKYKNSKRKILNCNSNIFVNQLYENTMGNVTLQTVIASQASNIYKHKNSKRKILTCNAIILTNNV